MSQDLYLVMNDTFLGSYMAARWLERFSTRKNFRGILLKGKQPSAEVLHQRRLFHQTYAGQMEWTDEMAATLTSLYGRFNDMEQVMVRMYGFPAFTNAHDERARFLGDDINSTANQEWLLQTCMDTKPYFFLYVSQIAKPWWIELTQGRVLNCHSAVLPYARGLYSIENVAALNDIEFFRKAAGVTVHYIDAGIDTGPLLRAERLLDPFQFDSIWELKACLYDMGCRVYVQMAQDISGEHGSIPASIVSDPQLRGPNYLRKHFTPEKKKQAEEGYLLMKARAAESANE